MKAIFLRIIYKITGVSWAMVFFLSFWFSLSPVTWTDPTNTTIVWDTVTKVAWWTNGWNADAHSNEFLTSQCLDWYVEFEAKDDFAWAWTYAPIMIGLNSDPAANASYTNIDYAIYIYRSGNTRLLRVYENGSYMGNFPQWVDGEIMRVERVWNTVEYKRNWVVFYTSLIPSANDLYVDLALYRLDTYVDWITIHAGSCCGDWAIDAWEQCDDGNLVDGDGCNNQCIVECDPTWVPDGSWWCTDLLCDIEVTTVTKNGIDVQGSQLEAWDTVQVSCNWNSAELYAMRARPIGTTARDQFSWYTAANPVSYTIPTSDAYEFQCYLRASGDSNGAPRSTEYCGEITTTYCGNWVVEWVEQCDDWDVENDDGCAINCTINPWFVCDSWSPNLCEFISTAKIWDEIADPFYTWLCEEAVSLSTWPIAYDEENFPHYIARLDDMSLPDITYSSSWDIQTTLDYSYLSPSCTSPGNFPWWDSRPTDMTTLNAMRLSGFLNVPWTPGQPVEWTIWSHVNDGLRMTVWDNTLFEYSWTTEAPWWNWKQYHRVTFPEPWLYPIEILWMTNALCTIDPLEIIRAPWHLWWYQDLDCYGLSTTHSCAWGATSAEFSLIDGDLLIPASTCQPCWDWIIDAGEECDDNNVLSDDGCSATCKSEYCRDDAPLNDTSKNLVVTDLTAWLIAWTSTQTNSEVAICFEDTTGTRDIFFTTTDASGAFTYTPNLTPYATPWVNVGVMLHDSNGLDIDHKALILAN